MEEQKKLQHLMGKSLGLMEKPIPLNKYKEKVDALSSHFRSKAVKELQEIAGALVAISREIDEQYKNILKKQKHLASQQTEIVSKANRLVIKNAKNTPIIEKKVEEIITVGLESLKKTGQMMTEQEQEILGLIKKFETLSKGALSQLETKYQAFLDEMEKNKTTYEACENGSLLGTALKAAVSWKPEFE